MSSIAIDYCKAIHKHLASLHATWPPNTAFRLGDFGYLRDGIFERKSALTFLGLKWTARKGQSQSSFSVTNAAGTQVQLRRRGEVLPGGVQVAKAHAEVAFAIAGGVFFNAAGCALDEVDDQVGLGRQLLSLFELGKWNDDWYVVTRLVRSKSSTIAVSQSAGLAHIRFEAAGDDPQIDLANASAKLITTSRSSVESVFVTEDRLTPLIGLSRVSRRFLGGAVFNLADDEQEDALEYRHRLLSQGESIEAHFEFADA